jgi:hypothetical protein
MDLNQLLAPPGHGVFTVHAAKERKDKLDHFIYGKHDPKESWLKSLRKIPSSKILLFGIPSDNGGGIHRGANWGPLVARECLLKESTQTFLDLGDIRVIPHYLSDYEFGIIQIKKGLIPKKLNVNIYHPEHEKEKNPFSVVSPDNPFYWSIFLLKVGRNRYFLINLLKAWFTSWKLLKELQGSKYTCQQEKLVSLSDKMFR